MADLELATAQDLAEMDQAAFPGENMDVDTSKDREEWEAWWRTLSPSDRQAEEERLLAGARVAPHPGPQTDAFLTEAEITGFGGKAGGGKAMSFNDLCATPKGFVKFADLKPGMNICDPFGSVQSINATVDWPEWETWRVEFSDGTHVDVAPQHEFTGWWSHIGRAVREGAKRTTLCGPAGAIKLETRQILEAMESGKLKSRFRIPLNEPVVGNFNRYQLDPYALGVILGDGSMPKRKGCSIGLHKDDAEIMDALLESLDGFHLQNSSRPQMLIGYLSTKSKAHTRLCDLGMNGKLAWEKELPESTLATPTHWRWSLLQGLMDTDGWCEPKRCAYYTTTSPHLRDGVAKLARSLGCFVTVTNKLPTYTHKGEKLQGRPAFTLRIKSATPEKLFRLRRKKEIAAQLEHQSLAKEITNITNLHEPQTLRCLSVSHPSGLYLTNDYTVTHNSGLLAMLPILEHSQSVIYRADASELDNVVQDLVRFYGSSEGLNRQDKIFRFGDRPNHFCEWAGLGKPGAELKRKGRARDFIGYDEVTEIPYEHFQYVQGWLRSIIPGQRRRVIATMNPPDNEAAMWVIEYWAPWVDENHPNPARSGEIRFFCRDEAGKMIEVPDGRPRKVLMGGQKKLVKPQSRTFIFASLDDNPNLAEDGVYFNQLWNMPEPQRSRLMRGDFRASIITHDNQIIPGEWIDQANERWKEIARAPASESPKHNIPMSALGVDVARGGKAFTSYSRRHDYWWDKMVRKEGASTPRGDIVAADCMMLARGECPICMDIVGVGASAFDFLYNESAIDNEYLYAVNSGIADRKLIPSFLRDLDHSLQIQDLGTRLWWALRKILDPSNGFDAALPPDARLKAQLTARRYQTAGGKIRCEPKAQTKERMGQSFTMDDADALVMTLYVIGDTPGSWRLRGGKHRQMPVQPATPKRRILSPVANRGRIRQQAPEKSHGWMGR